MTGIERARGEWIGLLDADDAWMPTKIADQLETARREHADGVFCGNISYTSGSAQTICYRGSMARRDLLPALIQSNVLSGGGSTMLVRRRVFDAIGGFDPAVNAAEDRDFFIRLVDHYPVAYVPRPLARIEVGPIRYGSNIERNLRNGLTIIERHAHRLTGMPGAKRLIRKARAGIHERVGLQYLCDGRYREAARSLATALRFWPFLANPWKALINVTTGRRRYGRPPSLGMGD
jgi:glycosyltransferase involved in cell wall biosynthesis